MFDETRLSLFLIHTEVSVYASNVILGYSFANTFKSSLICLLRAIALPSSVLLILSDTVRILLKWEISSRSPNPNLTVAMSPIRIR